jgi:GT2 family glycosyltransferase
MNDRKICFIACVNNDKYEQEMLKYINHLQIPEGYNIECLSIREAKSMASGYNEGMRSSDAKYKVYLHQDVFIVNQHFIRDMLDIFTDGSIGMLGMVGAPQMPENAIMWNAPRVGKIYYNAVYEAKESEIGRIEGRYCEVEAVDGLLMATQYDLPWREDLFHHWDFYDASQSKEFRCKGYKVVVPSQKQPWCIHDDGFYNLKNYYESRKIYNAHYRGAGMFQEIAEGLKQDGSNYEHYLKLAEYYRFKNISQAYLCYENAEFYCHSDEDRRRIRRRMEELRRQDGARIPPPVSVVIVSYNCSIMMQDCINSIRSTNPQSAYELVVVDNASEDGIAEWLEQQDNVILIRNQENKGFGFACNQGVEVSKPGHDIFFLNNDTVVTANAVFWLRMGLYEHEKVGAVGSMSNFVGNEQHIEKPCRTVAEYLLYSEKNNILLENPYEKKIWLSGFALLIRRKALEETGLFDLRFGKGYYEDDDLGVRLRYAGYQLLLCRNSFIFHYGSQSFRKDMDGIAEKMAVNRRIFQEKWGYDIEKYTYIHREYIEMIEAKGDMPLRVLEIGCGAGITLSRIKYMWPQSIVRGIEPNEAAARLGRDYLGVECGNAETMELPYEKEYFDYIIFNDILETFYSPDQVVNRFKPYLKDGGRMLFGIYNVMHVSVLACLLRGDFAYAASEILDQTHIRHFAVNDVLKLLHNCGLAVENLQGINTDMEQCGMSKEELAAIKQLAGENAQFLTVSRFIIKTKKR